jgi:hypothetical protein
MDIAWENDSEWVAALFPIIESTARLQPAVLEVGDSTKVSKDYLGPSFLYFIREHCKRSRVNYGVIGVFLTVSAEDGNRDKRTTENC